MEKFKKKVLGLSSDELICTYNEINEWLYGECKSVVTDADKYENYWKERPAYMEKLKIVENELSYRGILI